MFHTECVMGSIGCLNIYPLFSSFLRPSVIILSSHNPEMIMSLYKMVESKLIFVSNLGINIRFMPSGSLPPITSPICDLLYGFTYLKKHKV